MSQETILRNKVLGLVKKYYSVKPRDKFISGQTYVNYAGRVYDEKEMQALVDASLDFWLTSGRYAQKFEKEFAKYLGAKWTYLVNSGSSANLLAVSALTSPLLKNKRLKPGDEVITTACGFPTTLNPIIQNGCVPVFVDVELGTYNIQTEKIEKAITKKTKAIFVAHTLGNPVELDAIKRICKKHELWFLEDSCDALGGKYNGKKVGTFGDISTFSFYPAHHMTMGEGGAVATNDPVLRRALLSLRDWGRSCFVSGTQITLKGKSSNIEDINIGESVLTHEGKFAKVIDTFSRVFTGKMYKFKPRQLPFFEVTEDHKLLVQRKGDVRWISACEINDDDLLLEAVPLYSVAPRDFEWEYRTYYKNVKAVLPVERELLRLIGYWLAEGSLAKGFKGQSGYKRNQRYYAYRVSFAFSCKEKEYIEDVKKLMFKYFKVKGFVRRQRGGIELSFKTRHGYEFFKTFFKSGALNKTLSNEMEFWPLDILNSLVLGFWRGDGSNNWQSFSFCSISKELICKLRIILIRNGIVPTQEIRYANDHKSNLLNGRVVRAKHDLHNLVCYGLNAEKFSKIVEVAFTAKSPRKYAFFNKINGIRYICYPIYKITNKAVKGEMVYNLEVEGAHTYHAGCVVAHNCWCEPGHDDTCKHRFTQKFGELPYGYDHKYVYSHIGYNLKVTDMQAAIGCAQLEKLPGFIKARKENFAGLSLALRPYEKYLLLPKASAKSDPSWFGFPILVKDNAPFKRQDIVRYLESNKIATRMLFGGNLLKQPAYKGVKHRVCGGLANTDLVMNDLFWIGVYPGIDKARREYIIKIFTDFFAMIASKKLH